MKNAIEELKLTFDAVRDIVDSALFEGRNYKAEWRVLQFKGANWFRADVLLGDEVQKNLEAMGSDRPAALTFEEGELVRFDGVVNPELVFLWDMLPAHKRLALVARYSA